MNNGRVQSTIDKLRDYKKQMREASDMESFGNAFASYRKVFGLTQQTLTKAARIANKKVVSIEHGSIPDEDTMTVILPHLELDAESMPQFLIDRWQGKPASNTPPTVNGALHNNGAEVNNNMVEEDVSEYLHRWNEVNSVAPLKGWTQKGFSPERRIQLFMSGEKYLMALGQSLAKDTDMERIESKEGWNFEICVQETLKQVFLQNPLKEAVLRHTHNDEEYDNIKYELLHDIAKESDGLYAEERGYRLTSVLKHLERKIIGMRDNAREARRPELKEQYLLDREWEAERQRREAELENSPKQAEPQAEGSEDWDLPITNIQISPGRMPSKDVEP